MNVVSKLSLIAIPAITGIGCLAMALTPPGPAPDYTAGSPYPENSWEFRIYGEDGSVSSMGYNLTLWECLKLVEQHSPGMGRACERQFATGTR